MVLDPFMGSGTTAAAAIRCGRHYVGFELNAEYCELIEKRLQVLMSVDKPGTVTLRGNELKPASEEI